MSELLSQLEGRERRAECEKHDAEMREPACRGLEAKRTPGELSAIWCLRCGKGTIAGLCRNKSAAFFAECEAEARQIVRTA